MMPQTETKPTPDRTQILDHADVIDINVDQIKNSLAILQDGLSSILSGCQTHTEEERENVFLLTYEAAKINSDLIKLATAYRMSRKLLPIRTEENSLLEFLEDELLQLKGLLETRNLKTTLNCADDLLWYFDADLVSMILSSVLLNTIRYSRERILVSVKVLDQCLHILVEDDSNGFPSAMLTDTLAGKQNESLRSSKGASVLFCEEVAALHRQDGRRGSVNFRNNSSLGGGLFSLILP